MGTTRRSCVDDLDLADRCGPWEVDVAQGYEGEITVSSKEAWVLSVFYDNDNNLDKEVAMCAARLAAAAPAMYSALKELVNDWHSKSANFHKKDPKRLKMARSAIAKAEGSHDHEAMGNCQLRIGGTNNEPHNPNKPV